MTSTKQHAFTLIELAILLVMIGLLVGGVLVGRDLILTAEARAQIAQIESLRSATNTFRGKFDGLPGDLQSVQALLFGFNQTADGCNGTAQGFRDGNGNIEGATGTNSLQAQGEGETAFFWADLSTAKLINDNFPYASVTRPQCGTGLDIPQTALSQYFPAAKLGRGNYLYVAYMTQTDAGSLNRWGNYLGIAAVTSVQSSNVSIMSGASIPVTIAYAIDQKMDDGNPRTGIVIVGHLTNGGGLGNFATWDLSSNATGSTANSCLTIDYSTTPVLSSYNSPTSGSNSCALAFKFQ